jgi:hypothetical protein
MAITAAQILRVVPNPLSFHYWQRAGGNANGDADVFIESN